MVMVNGEYKPDAVYFSEYRESLTEILYEKAKTINAEAGRICHETALGRESGIHSRLERLNEMIESLKNTADYLEDNLRVMKVMREV